MGCFKVFFEKTGSVNDKDVFHFWDTFEECRLENIIEPVLSFAITLFF